MRVVLGLVFVMGCVQAAGTSSKRWPNHRKLRDQQLEQIEARTTTLEQRIEQLTRELANAKTALVKLQTSQAPAQPSSSELPTSGGATP